MTHLARIVENRVNLDVGTDTAISPHVGVAKKNQIHERLGRLAIDLKGGDLEPGEIQIDGDLAGVIIHKRDGYDPDKVAAFAVALVWSGGQWLPAPVPASFENTGAALDFERRQRAAGLERWMLRERARSLDTLREEQITRMRRDIAATISHDDLKAMTVRDMANTFLDAAKTGDHHRLLGLVGGLSDPLPGDWPARLRSVQLATSSGDSQPSGWRILADPAVPRAIVLEESTARDGLFTLAFIDPSGEVPRGGVPGVSLLHIDMQRDPAGAWRLNLPAAFNDTGSAVGPPGDQDSPFDTDLLDAFPRFFREASPATPQETPEALWEKMRECIAADTPDALLRLLALPEDSPQQARLALGRATRFWWQNRFASGGRTLVPLAFHQDGDQAMAMAQLFAFREPDRTDLRAFHMVRLPQGWMWQSTGRQSPLHPIRESLVNWRTEQEQAWQKNWIAELLIPAPKLESLKPDSPVDPAAAIDLVQQWIASIKAEDAPASLAHTAVLDDEEGRARLLRNLGYELSTQITEIDGEFITRSGKHWTVVCFRRLGDANPGMALLPVVTTPSGPRILLEIDLFVGTRQRDFLNNVALERLDGFTDDAVRNDLRNLLQELNREFAPAAR